MISPTTPLIAADTYPAGEPTTDQDHARYDRDGWMESAIRAQGEVADLRARLAAAESAVSAAVARAEGMEKALADPVAVHANMLRGTIARPSIANIVHLYGRAALAAALGESEGRANVSTGDPRFD